jgi:hypothetical protein
MTWQRRLPARTAQRGWVHDHALSLALLALFLASWVAQLLTQAAEVAEHAAEHGTPQSVASTLVSGDFWAEFGAATFENWQSEFLQLLVFVTLTAHLIHRGSAESPDGDDELKAMVEELLARTVRMERSRRGETDA